MKVNVCTSYFAAMARRRKAFNDVYISITRSSRPYCPLKDEGGIPVQSQIDYSFPDLANYGPLDDWERDLPEGAVEDLVDFLRPENWEFGEGDPETDEVNVFILCVENLKARYTKKDEEKFYDVRAGEPKRCHRTMLAGILREKYGINAVEYEAL